MNKKRRISNVPQTLITMVIASVVASSILLYGAHIIFGNSLQDMTGQQLAFAIFLALLSATLVSILVMWMLRMSIRGEERRKIEDEM